MIVFEDLRTQSMTRRPKPKQNSDTKKFEKNHASQKAGLNKAILNIGWHKLEVYTKYKAHRAGKAFLKCLLIIPIKNVQLAATFTPRIDKLRKSLFVCLVATKIMLTEMPAW